jgi:aspartate aminotransferase
MRTSALASAIADPATLKLNEKATSLKASGMPVIHLGSGEPNAPAPVGALDAARAKLATAEIKYSPSSGTPALKKAIVEYTKSAYGYVCEPGNVMVSAGAKPAIYAALMALVEPGDEVVFPAPYWVSYPEMATMLGGVPVVVESEPGTFEPSFAAMKAAITDRTRAVILNSPNNPSGHVYSADLVRQVVGLCEDLDICLIMDDIYHKLVFDGCRAASAFDFAKRTGEDSVIVAINGVSKLYAMTGFRIGWAVASKRMIGVMKNIQAQILSCPSSLSEAAAVGALTGDQSCVENLRLKLQNNKDLIVRELATIPNVRLNVPCGTFYSLPDFSAYDTDSHRLSAFLLDKVMVATVPGKDFGAEGHQRISFCGKDTEIVEGIARIRWALDPDSPREIVIGTTKLVKDWL